MSKKYQIFISSTFKDLIDERQDTARTILDLHHIPSGMEWFPATNEEQFSYIKQIIDECDYYVLIIGARYGTVTAEGVSFTEREYDYAIDAGKFVLVFIHSNLSEIPLGKADTDPALVERLNNFRIKASNGRMVKYWTNRDNLQTAIAMSLIHAVGRHPAVGWIRGDNLASEDLVRQNNLLLTENEDLRKKLIAAQNKTTLVASELAGMDDAFTLTFSHEIGFNQRRTSSIDIKWKDIFIATAPYFVRPSSPDLFRIGLTYLLGKHFNNLDKVEPDVQKCTQARFHLEAVGLFSSYAGQAVNSGIAEFMSLTEAGKARLMELLAVRKVIPEKDSSSTATPGPPAPPRAEP